MIAASELESQLMSFDMLRIVEGAEDEEGRSDWHEPRGVHQSGGQDEPIDLLINNAGIGGVGCLDKATKNELMKQPEANTGEPFLMMRASLPNLKFAVAKSGSATVEQAISRMGSIAGNGSGDWYGYRASKCALIMVNFSLAIDLKQDKIIALTLHTVARMTGNNGQVTTEESVAGLAKIIAEATPGTAASSSTSAGTIPW